MAEPRRAAEAAGDDLKGARILIVEARFYDDIADALLAGAAKAVEAAGASFEWVSVPARWKCRRGSQLRSTRPNVPASHLTARSGSAA